MKASTQRRRKSLRLKDYDYKDGTRAYFVTLCAKKGTRPFEHQKLAVKILDGLQHLRRSQKCRVFCYCLMPDHLHAVLSPLGGTVSIPDLLRDLKSFTTRGAWDLGWSGRIWQRSFYDHIGRRREDLVRMCDYILANPVRRGLVKTLSDWPHSGQPDPLPW